MPGCWVMEGPDRPRAVTGHPDDVSLGAAGGSLQVMFGGDEWVNLERGGGRWRWVAFIVDDRPLAPATSRDARRSADFADSANVIVPPVGMPRSGPRAVRRYSKEFKLTAVRLSQQPGIQVKAVVGALEIHPFMLSKWRKM